MKAIYTIINKKIYNLVQSNQTPNQIIWPLLLNNASTSTTVCNRSQKAVKTNFYFTDFDSSNVKSNKEKSDEMIRILREDNVTEIDKVYNNYTVAVDYTIYDSDNCEISHSIAIKPMKNSDFIYPLGVNSDNECVYKQIKSLTVDLDWEVIDKLPYGIICNANKKTTLVINDISIYQDTHDSEDVNNHPSIYSHPFRCNSCTIDTSLENKILVYSTKKENIEIQPIIVDFKPRFFEASITFDLSNIIVIYDDETIKNILTENIKIRDGLVDNNDAETSIDEEPVEKTYVYERSTNDNSLSVRVVEDAYPEEYFDSSTMVHKSDVLEDIPDITVGEYVIKTIIQ